MICKGSLGNCVIKWSETCVIKDEVSEDAVEFY